jgi:serine/threonine-protein kinase PknK
MIKLIAEYRGTRRTFSFPSDAVAIGRGDENDLRLGSRFVSVRHCRIELPANGAARVVDLDSQNGTRVNGEFASRRRLHAGDRVDVGPVVIWFENAPPGLVTTAAPPEDDEEAAEDDVAITARAVGGDGPEDLVRRLEEICVEFRVLYGDDRAAAEVEAALAEVGPRVFGRKLSDASRDAQRLAEITRALNSTLDAPKLLALILDAAIEQTKSERGFLLMRNESGGWDVRVARNFDHEAVKGGEHKVSHGVAEEVAKTGQTVVAFDAQKDGRFASSASVSELKLRSVLCVPLKRRADVVGVLYLDNRFQDGVYGERERRMIETFADQAAIALENARLYAEAETFAARTKTLEDATDELRRRLSEAHEAPVMPSAPRTREGLKYPYPAIIGTSPVLVALLGVLDRVVESDLPVLITGESGTGKELIARAIHEYSRRKHGPFVRENCAAIPENLLESELFGYRRGSFTGAQGDKRGLFEEADRGTIFLDEVGEMSLGMQSKLMRVLQDGEIRSVGARTSITVDVRVISATNRELRRMAHEGKFREDLFFRLNVVNLHLPPLRERPEDVDQLVSYFIGRIAEKSGRPPKAIEPAALRALRRYSWPGNIRELQNEIQRAHALSGASITVADLWPDIQQAAGGPGDDTGRGTGGLKEIARLASAQKERELILQALEASQWRKSAAARRLGVSRPTLDQKIKQFGLTELVDRGRRG